MKIISSFLFLLTILFIGCEAQNNNELKATEQNNGLRFLALGDSYTIGESVDESARWPAQLKDSLKVREVTINDLRIIATTGWRTDQLKSAMTAPDKSDYDMVSLLIGVNNQYQGKSVIDYRPEFEELLNLAIDRAGGEKNRVFVVSIPDYGFTPFGKENQEKITAELDDYNAVNREISDTYGIRYFDITPISRKGLDDPELVAEDGLHPSGRQYALWVAEMMKDEAFVEGLKEQQK